MVAEVSAVISLRSPEFDYPDACEIARRALAVSGIGLIFLDFSRVKNVTTGAYAKLVHLRGHLLKAGRDLRIVGLQDRALSLAGSISSDDCAGAFWRMY